LHKAWISRVKRAKYRRYVPALEAGIAKIEEYYNRIDESDAYVMGMCEFLLLHPAASDADLTLSVEPERKTGLCQEELEY
jgi:hypothetical protein